MKEADRHKRNSSRLTELYSTFSVRISRVIDTLQAAQLRPRIQSAWRSPEDQQKAYDEGHAQLLYGFHNVTGKNGALEALAVDLLDDENPLNPGTSYLLQLAAAAEAEGLVTGIRWGLPSVFSKAVDDAISTRDWSRKVKVGWDPTHVQPTDVTVSEARNGRRPA